MKKILQKMGMVIAVLLGSLSSYAYDFEVDGVCYDVVSLQDLTCEVVKGSTKYSGEVIIPEDVTYKDRKFMVVAIEENAFMESKELTKVTIPNSITSLPPYTFYECEGLTSVLIPNSVEEIGEGAFAYCYSLTDIILPNSVTDIAYGLFYNCSSLKSLVIPTSVIEIGSIAFNECVSLESVTIPESVVKIGELAFNGCCSLNSVTIPNSLTEIEERVFDGCSSLSSVTIPDSINIIGTRAFGGCSSLISVIIPDSVTEIGIGAFTNCSSLTSVTIGNSVNKLGYHSFADCISLTYVSIGGGVEKIDEAFPNCKSITKLRLSYSPYTIDFGDDREWLETIQELYTDRPIYIFNQDIKLPNLEKLELGESATTVKGLYNLSELKSIECYALVPPELPYISNSQFMDVNVFVPEEALETYKADPVWGNFWNLQASGVDGVKVDSKREVIGRYDLNGRSVSEDYQGLVIVRFSDGSCKKMLNR